MLLCLQLLQLLDNMIHCTLAAHDFLIMVTKSWRSGLQLLHQALLLPGDAYKSCQVTPPRLKQSLQLNSTVLQEPLQEKLHSQSHVI